MKNFTIIFFLSIFILASCSKIRDSAGVNRKSIDEFTVIEKPPLVIPPDFNLLPPDQLSEKNLSDIESSLAKEILFGLDDESLSKNSKISTMDNILDQTKANLVSNDIRNEIDENFASEKKVDSESWDSEIEILDSINESKRLRSELINNEKYIDRKIPKIKVQEKNKKKKRFFFF
tara:strand:+ start:5772 stop:6299 length:528 start_codon:yes stop_codon:yes gene_type:complete